MNFTYSKDGNYYTIHFMSRWVTGHILESFDKDDVQELLSVFSKKIDDETAISIIKDLKAERDLVSFGLSLNGEGLTSDRITEIDRIISKLSERFINS